MPDQRDGTRNPMIIPDVKPVRRRGCPMCGEADWDAFMSMGVATFTCRKCKNRWQGGVGMEPQDPTVPTAPINPKDLPKIDFYKNTKTGLIEELRRRPDPTQSFRQGAPIPNPGEENDV